MTCGSGYWSGNCNNVYGGAYPYNGIYGNLWGSGLGCGLGYGNLWGAGLGCGLGYGAGLGCGLGYGNLWGAGLGCGLGYGAGLGCGLGLGYGAGLGCGCGVASCLGGCGLGINSYYPYYAGSLPCWNQIYPYWGSNCGIFPGYGNAYFPSCLSGSYFPWYNNYSQNYTLGKRCKVSCN